jgi:hypothetical protein
MTTNECFTLIFSGVVTVSTIAYVYLTARLVKETRIMRKSQVEPQIIAYLDLAETKADIVYLKTKNIGLGVAKNVRFTIIKDLDYPDARKLSNYKYFAEGINYFPPSHEDKHLLFSFHTETKDKGVDYIELRVEYESVLKEKKIDQYKLEFKELSGKGNLIPPDTHIGNISYRIEKIEKILETQIKEK